MTRVWEGRWTCQRLGVMTTLAALCLFSQPSAAQDATRTAQDPEVMTPVLLSPLIVTGQPKATDAQDVPAPLSVITQDLIEDAAIEHMTDVPRYVPGFEFADQGSQSYNITSVRGIGDTVRNDYFNSPFGVYVDGVLVPSHLFQRYLGDVEQVELLRGPQGTRFGGNSLSGALNIVTRRPSDDFEASSELTGGTPNLRHIQARTSGPLVEGKLNGKVYASYLARDGWTENTLQDESADYVDDRSIAAALDWQATERLEVRFSGDYNRIDAGAGYYLPYDTFEDREVELSGDNYEVVSRGSGAVHAIYDMGGAQLDWISSATSYDMEGDSDLRPFLGFSLMAPSEGDGYRLTQEIRVSGDQDDGPLSWLAGVYGQLDDQTFLYPSFGLDRARERDEIAAFSEVTYTLFEKLDLTAGVRVARASEVAKDQSSGNEVSGSWTFVTPRFVATYHVDDDLLAYASATRGARTGGFDWVSSMGEYDTEYTWTYEIGTKFSALGGRLNGSVSLFHTDWEDQQVFSQSTPGVTAFANSADSHVNGVETELQYHPTAGLTLGGFAGVTDGEFDTFTDRNGNDGSGNALMNTPEFTAGLNARYRWPISGTTFNGFVHADWRLTGSQYFDPENELKQDTYSTTNLRLGIEGDNLDVLLFVENLFDQDYRTYGYIGNAGLGDVPVAVAGPERVIGATLRVRF